MEREKEKKSHLNLVEKNEVVERFNSIIPVKAFFSLKEACSLKGLNYKTSANRPYLQPNRGRADGKIGGKKAFSRETILNWLPLTDEDIISNNGYSNAS